MSPTCMMAYFSPAHPGTPRRAVFAPARLRRIFNPPSLGVHTARRLSCASSTFFRRRISASVCLCASRRPATIVPFPALLLLPVGTFRLLLPQWRGRPTPLQSPHGLLAQRAPHRR